MFRSGQPFGPYLLTRKLGTGGFGEVWLAEKRSAAAETVFRYALKISLDEEADPETFRKEVKSWSAAMGHPNVLAIVDADVWEGVPYIVSEYCPEGSLSGWMQENGGGAPGPQAAVDMTAGILEGLAHLHGRGVLHRDLKPANILLQGGRPRIADFGLARVLSSSRQRSAVAGTPVYMAPEAFDGARSERTDLWSVGVILYQMVEKRLPYPQGTPTEILKAMLTQEPDPVSDATPPGLRRVLEGALARDPARRYPTAQAFLEELKAWHVSASPSVLAAAAAGAAVAATVIDPTAAIPPPSTARSAIPPPAPGSGQIGAGATEPTVQASWGAPTVVDARGPAVGQPTAPLPAGTVLLYFECPVCGRKNPPQATFRCRRCGKDNLCLRHFVEAAGTCAECTPPVAAATRGGPAPRRASWPWLLLLLLVVGGAAAASLLLMNQNGPQTPTATAETTPTAAPAPAPEPTSPLAQPAPEEPIPAPETVSPPPPAPGQTVEENPPSATHLKPSPWKPDGPSGETSGQPEPDRKPPERQNPDRPPDNGADNPRPPRPEPRPGQPVRMRTADLEARLVRRVEPIQPRGNMKGLVILAVVVDERGNVTELNARSGHPQLIEAALDAVRQWKYKPLLRNGQRVPMMGTIVLPFSRRR